MKGWPVIHKVKALYDEGRGSSIREISRELRISRNTVRRYLRRSVSEIETALGERTREKVLDGYREFFIHQLEHYPRLSAVKLRRRLESQVGEVAVSARSFRRYVNGLREKVNEAQPRYYEPVLDMVPGVQCQVDPGELRGVSLGGALVTLYFVVFVLSWSRLMYVALSRRVFDTQRFIAAHDEAFRYFGGCPKECVYDQTRMVVLEEQHRELTLNERFAHYATAAGFTVRACEGYDPESKGKVESGVKYVKNDGLYGEVFTDWNHAGEHLRHWLETVANVRVHGTTGQRPRARFEETERAVLQPYFTPALLATPPAPGVLRKVDKTGLLSFEGNRYSAPMAFQRARVRVVATEDGQVHLHHPETGERVATHPRHPGKGGLVKNGDHYRDKAKDRAALEADIVTALGPDFGPGLCRQLRRRDPVYYLDKLRGLKRHLSRVACLPPELLHTLVNRPDGLTIRMLLDYLGAWEANPERALAFATTSPPPSTDNPAPSNLLSAYQALLDNEARHDFH